MPQSASVVVSRALPDVEAHLWTVTNWVSCLTDVVSARRHSHERYAVELRAGRRIEEVLVAVRWNARHHRFSWKGLDGPTWAGELRLSPVNGRRTRIDLDVVSVPRTFLSGIADLIGGGRRDLTADVLELHDMIHELPAPIRPSRIAAGATIPELAVPSGAPAARARMLAPAAS
jgi:hypothetical protein